MRNRCGSGVPAAIGLAEPHSGPGSVAARYFPPGDPVEMAAAVEDVLADEAGWSAKGIDHAAGFTWERSASAHEEVYRELLA